MENRILKFRAWDKFNESMLKPHDVNGSKKDLSWFFSQFDEAAKGGNDLVLMQFTGLLDKKGNDIYEGDMVQHDAWDYPFEVIFAKERARFVCKMKTGLTQYIDNKRLKAIGSVFQNPELLK